MLEKKNVSVRKIRVALFGAGKMAMHHAKQFTCKECNSCSGGGPCIDHRGKFERT
jgi:hypothetical protein